MQNAILGEFRFETDQYDGEKVEVTHIPSGNSAVITKDGGVVPQGYENENLPTSPDTGAIFIDNDRGLPAWYDRDHYEWPTFVDDVKVTETTVSDTTTRTTVWDPDINPDSLIIGRTYQMDLFGKFSTANTSARFTVDIDLAGTDVAGVRNVGGNVTDAPWSLEFTFSVRSDGQNGELQSHTRGLFNSNSEDSHGTVTSVDTTTATTLEVSFQWNETGVDNSATLGQAHLKQMG